MYCRTSDSCKINFTVWAATRNLKSSLCLYFLQTPCQWCTTTQDRPCSSDINIFQPFIHIYKQQASSHPKMSKKSFADFWSGSMILWRAINNTMISSLSMTLSTTTSTTYIIFKCYYLLFQVVSWNFVILDNARNLKLLDAVCQWNELCCNIITATFSELLRVVHTQAYTTATITEQQSAICYTGWLNFNIIGTSTT